MGSTRLPGKVLKRVAGKPLLDYLIERLHRVRLADDVVIATTTNYTDDTIVEFCGTHQVNCFRGSENDVLARYYGAASKHKADTVVRVTSDCPLIDPQIIDRAITVYRDHIPNVDYVSNTIQRTYPRGMDCEVFSFRVLKEVHEQAEHPADREHVTPFIYNHPEKYNIEHFTFARDESQHRWTVDTHEDFLLVSRIIENLYPIKPQFDMEDCLRLLTTYPRWQAINNGVTQKVYGQ